MAENIPVSSIQDSARTTLALASLRQGMNAPASMIVRNAGIPERREKSKADLEREMKVAHFHGSFGGLKSFLEEKAYSIKTRVIKDTEGVGKEAEYDGGLQTFDGEPVYVHTCEINGMRYYMNNSKQKVCPDFNEQVKPIMNQIERQADHIVSASAKLHHDTRLFIDLETDIKVAYKNDKRGDGTFNQHIMIEGALSSAMDWGFFTMLYRQVCSNGMFAFTQHSIKNMKKTASMAERINAFDISKVETFEQTFDMLQEIPVAEANAIKLLAKFPLKWQEVIMTQARLESEHTTTPTAWALYQGISYIIDHGEFSDSTRQQYQAIGREIMQQLTGESIPQRERRVSPSRVTNAQ